MNHYNDCINADRDYIDSKNDNYIDDYNDHWEDYIVSSIKQETSITSM